jgi:hypothetical protein
MNNTPLVTLNQEAQLIGRIRVLLVIFIIGLVLSGLTAFPLEWELRTLARWMGAAEDTSSGSASGLLFWILRVREGLTESYGKYPFLAYGTDWLAFAHIVIGLAFLGVLRDPVRNLWVIEWGMIACILVIPLALICGPIRGIPFYWRLIDCSFGVLGIAPLWLSRRYILELGQLTSRLQN